MLGAMIRGTFTYLHVTYNRLIMKWPSFSLTSAQHSAHLMFNHHDAMLILFLQRQQSKCIISRSLSRTV